jgi:cytochrome c-type biogenesis protein CcmH
VETITSLPEDEQMAMIRDMVEGLATRLADEPDDLEGWSRLAQSYAVLGEWQNARDAYAHALSLAPGDTNLADGLANAVSGLLPPDGSVPAGSVAAYETVLDASPDNQQALYYLGLAAHQAGDDARAVELWTRLRDQLPEGGNQRAFIDQKLREAGGS